MDNNNLIAAIILSLLILMGFQYFYAKPQQEQVQHQALTQELGEAPKTSGAEAASTLRDRADIIKEDRRVPITTPELTGSINLKGGRIDDLSFTHYRETIDPQSPAVVLLSPADSAPPHLSTYAEFSWLSGDDALPVPTSTTEWATTGKDLTPEHPVKLSWDNGKGLVFERSISIDSQFMFTFTDRIHNATGKTVTLYPFGLVARQAETAQPSSRLFEGPLGVINGTLKEYAYKKLIDDGKKTEESEGGWLGITDKYWLVAMVLPGDEKLAAEFSYNGGSLPMNDAKQPAPKLGWFQADFRGVPMTIAPGASIEHSALLFAGAKRVRLLDHYVKIYGIPHFDRAIDFGWFWFLAKPFLYLLDYLSGTLGSFALAILVFTVMLKLVTLPLTLKSSHSMSRMKKLQPEIKRIQERFAEDKVRQSQEMMELYKREKVSPLSGCVPTLIQIPIFFALYKVLYVGIEMRQAPFFGWIHDLSAPDPSSICNLFGLFPDWPQTWHLNLMLFSMDFYIGAWPLLMGCSMFLQQRLSPQPPDKSQARMLSYMPLFFTYMLRNMPAGLVIYWTWSNLLSILQQWYIMRQDARREGNA